MFVEKPDGLDVPGQFSRGAKIGAYGMPGTGKTELVMSATEVAKLYLIDCEGRSQYYDPKKDKGFEAIYTTDPKVAFDVLRYVESLHKAGEAVCFAIDGWSAIWYTQQEVAEGLGITSFGTTKYTSWAIAKKPLKALYDALYETPIDCIITMQAKPAYTDDATKPEKLGYDKPVTELGLNYAVDLVLEMRKAEKKPGDKLVCDDFGALIVKTSGPKEGNPFPIGTVITNPKFSKLVGLRRVGSGVISISSTVELQITLAGITKAEHLKALIAKLGLDEKTAFDSLKEKFGAWNKSRVGEYAEFIVSLKGS
jgi:hypothetical protein